MENKTKMDVQKEIQEIHSKYGTTEVANYKIQLFIEELINKRVINELERLVSESTIDTTCDEDDIDYQEISLHDTLERIKQLKQN